MKKFICLYTILIVSFQLFSQTYQIKEASTKEAIPFVKIYPKTGTPFLADLDGRFSNSTGNSKVTLKMMGFRDTTYTLGADSILLMVEEGNLLDEVTIVPGINPAERIMAKAIENRKTNHPKSDIAYKYDAYSKFIFTMNPETVAAISDTTSDTNLIQIKKFFNSQHIFMLESTAEQYFKPPFKEKEIITAYRVSGFTDPMFSTFADQIQSFNFYDNQFDLLGKSYLNPLALGSIRRYLFILQDSTINEKGDTTFTIRFQPRKDKNFDGMKGVLYINTNGFAIERVIAEPAKEDKTFNVKITQEYTFLEGKKWFPHKLSTDITLPIQVSSKIKDAYLVGKGNTYIENVELNADLKGERFNAVFIETERDANEKDSTHWDAKRKYQLDEKELRTYEMIDSVSKAENLERRLNTLQALAQGKIPLGYVQSDITRLINYRDYEGFRLGAGLETSERLSKRFMVGSYFAYGFKDKMWKYGGYGKVTLWPKQYLEFEARYQEDIIERGSTNFSFNPIITQLNSFYQNLYIRQMDKQRIAEVAFSGYIFPRLKFRLSGSYQRIGFTKDYSYQWNNNSMGLQNIFEVAETSLELTWSIRDKVISLGTKRISMGSKWPIITGKITKNIPGWTPDKINYTRWSIGLQQIVPIRAVGKLTYLLTYSGMQGDAPLLYQFVGIGTGRNHGNISVANTFETMLPSTYYATQLTTAFTRFDFKAFKTKVKWTKPQIAIHHGIGYGLSDKNTTNHSIGYLTMNKGYAETGLLVNDLLKVRFLGLGIGGFYHYAGGLISPYVKNNILVKFSMTIKLF